MSICKHYGQSNRILSLWSDTQTLGLSPNYDVAVHVVLACTSAKSQKNGMIAAELVHSFQGSTSNNSTLHSMLINMWVQCGMPHKALDVWQSMLNQNMKLSHKTYILLSPPSFLLPPSSPSSLPYFFSVSWLVVWLMYVLFYFIFDENKCKCVISLHRSRYTTCPWYW